jgi:ABC-type ATPase with predicted acetyltransferase domain
MSELNSRLSMISRVVVHPKYRTIGLGAKLVRDTLSLVGTEYVEMPAVMAKYNPFAEKAGMNKITEQPPVKEAVKINYTLQTLGFNTELLGSKSYALKKLQDLNQADLSKIRMAFVKNSHIRFKKAFSGNMPFGRTSQHIKNIEDADLETLVNLVKICGFLLQSKVYMFWQKI